MFPFLILSVMYGMSSENLILVQANNKCVDQPEHCVSIHVVIVGEPKSRIVQKHTFFAPERYTAGILYTDSLDSA